MTASPDQCVSFYAVDDQTGVASTPTTLEVQAPLPTETPTMGPVTMLEKNVYPWRQAEFSGLEAGNHIGYAVLPGSCPEEAPAVSRWRTQLQGEGPDPVVDRSDYGLFPSAAADVNCVVWTSLDWFGLSGARTGDGTGFTDRHGPVSMREFVDEGPLPPTVGTPVWNPTSQKFELPVANVNGLHVVWDPSDPTTCPPPDASGLQQVSFTGNSEVVVLAPPADDVCLTFYNVASEGPVPTSFGTPVQLTVPPGG